MGIAEARETIRACKHCFMCRYISPGFIATKLESLTPHGYGILLSQIDMGVRQWSDEVADKFYQSPLGGECRQDCEYAWPEDDMARHAREEIVRAGRAPSQVKEIAAALLATGTAYGERSDWLARHDRSEGEPSEVLFLAGPTIEHDQPATLDAVESLFGHAGLSWSTMADEAASGMLLFDLGYVDEARESAEKLARQIVARKPAVVVSACPHTLRAVRSHYPGWGVRLPNDIELLHTTELLSSRLRSFLPAGSGALAGVALAYHDCAELGRQLGLFEAPRRIIGELTGQPAVEFYRNREQAESSGAGSSMFITHPELAAKIAEKTLEGVSLAETRTVVTACPNCRTSFERAVARAALDLRVADITEMLAGELDQAAGGGRKE